MVRKKPQLYFEHKQYLEYGYEHTKITVRAGQHETLDALIDRCVDNKIGYYDGPEHTGLETAAKMTRRYQWLKSQGYSSIWVGHYGDRAILDLTWLHASSGRYCEAKIGMPENLSPVRETLAILNRLVTSMARHGVLQTKIMDNPSYVLGALRRSKAIELQEWTVPQ